MSKKLFFILLFLAILVNCTGLFGTIFMRDSSLYAIISKSFVESGNYLDIYVNGNDWLDKPHFPFWVCALSIKVFGATTFAYKLPSLLFFLVGLYYTYKMAFEFYGKQVAFLATLILASSLHIILSNNDVRAESILLGLVMGSLYYLNKLKHSFTFANLLLAALFGACAVMTKGIFVLIIFYSAIALNLFFRKEYKLLFHYRWFLAIGLTLLFTAPEVYAVYHQFDLHPEKTVFGTNNVSGVKFFLWDSQFGRFFNTGPIKGKGDPFFFLTTLFWAFAPWAILGLISLFTNTKSLFKKREGHDYTFYFAFLIMFLLFSLSKFQLPHYTNILFPFLAIIVAKVIIENKEKLLLKINKVFIYVYCVLYILVVVVLEYFFRTDNLILAIGCVLLAITVFVISVVQFKESVHKVVVMGGLSTLSFFLYMNLCFYPSLLKYQYGSEIAFYLNDAFPERDIKTIESYDWNLQYYLKQEVTPVSKSSEVKKNDILVLNEDNYQDLKDRVELVKTFDSFHVTKLKADFIYHKTRAEAVIKYYVVKVIE